MLTSAVALVLALTGPTSVKFASLPTQVAQNKIVVAAVTVEPPNAKCALSVKYANGSTQPGLKPTGAIAGRASWVFKVAPAAAAGAARATATCGRARVTKTFRVVKTIGGSVAPIKLNVVKSGFSIRPKLSGGSDVSYGVLIQNTSKDSDAVRVFALVNFVYSDNVLYGSATSMINVIGAGQTYALGGMLAFPSGAPVLHLEVVLQVGGREPHSLQLPELSNTRVMGSSYDPGWVGSVEGELANNVKGQVLQSTKLSTVLLDAAGNVLGGGVGFAIAALPPGAREFYKITSGLPPIPLDKAASAVVSLEPRYRPVEPA